METHTACLDLAPFQPAEVAAISRDSRQLQNAFFLVTPSQKYDMVPMFPGPAPGLWVVWSHDLPNVQTTFIQWLHLIMYNSYYLPISPYQGSQQGVVITRALVNHNLTSLRVLDRVMTQHITKLVRSVPE